MFESLNQKQTIYMTTEQKNFLESQRGFKLENNIARFYIDQIPENISDIFPLSGITIEEIEDGDGMISEYLVFIYGTKSKNKKRKILNLSKVALIFLCIVLFSCKGKEGAPGPQGNTGAQGQPGPTAVKYSFSLTFGPSITFGSYGGLMGNVTINDLVLVYVKYSNYAGTDYYTLLPMKQNPIYLFAEVGTDGNIFIDAAKADGTAGSPFLVSTKLDFEAVIIRGSRNQKIGYAFDYNMMKSTYNF
jgi:hypothetical protein